MQTMLMMNMMKGNTGIGLETKAITFSIGTIIWVEVVGALQVIRIILLGIFLERRSQTFTRTSKDHRFDPKNVIVRRIEMVQHPESNAIIVALDVTGSLGHMAKTIAEKGLGNID